MQEFLTYVYAIRGTAISQPEIDVQGNANSIVNGDVTPSHNRFY